MMWDVGSLRCGSCDRGYTSKYKFDRASNIAELKLKNEEDLRGNGAKLADWVG